MPLYFVDWPMINRNKVDIDERQALVECQSCQSFFSCSATLRGLSFWLSPDAHRK